MKLDLSYSVIPATCHGEASERRRKPESRLKSWTPAFAGVTEEVTRFFFDQTGRLRPAAGLTGNSGTGKTTFACAGNADLRRLERFTGLGGYLFKR